MWSDYLQNLRGGDVRRAVKYVDPRAGSKVEALMNREGKQANTAIEKDEILRLLSITLNDNDQYCELLPAGSAHMEFTEKLLSGPCTPNQSRRHQARTKCLLKLFICSGTGIQRGL